MGSQGVVVGVGVGGNSIDGIQNQARPETHDPLSNLLSRQGSFYNLTLDEVQSHLGDIAESNNNNNQTTGGVDDVAPLSQHSNLMLSDDLSKKTVDEVWQDIQHGQERSSLDRKGTLGEMTLEDFLVKAGIVAESASGRRKTGAGSGHGAAAAQWMNYQIPSLQQQQQQQNSMMPVFMPGHHPISLGGGNSVMDVSSPLMGTLSDTQTPGRKRVAPDEIAEKCVERRQKRMIKNRESAARSRARKQAYTHELENKVSRLEEENERLKRQQELEKMLPSIPPPEPKYQLRRTSSAPT
ncbi:hypothetical protein MIMGU_mgv1a010984mg [Erythranthe guttata]|uniref:BZIP domain-containing protein n=1 Tax=Erythranthe guttata TaxID=4155 RepID=A0A022R5X8_ERYGU|nr:hypothetical protein MIMGU_mgv1a010984mg [Erythranthe guttata]